MTNPFAIPGLDDDPIRPLCPWDEDTPEHEKYYAPVDHTKAAYDTFTSQMARHDALRKYGRLVLVAGESGCGKTSLMNRCVNWLKTNMKREEEPKVGVRVINLVTASSANKTVGERMTQVARLLAHEVLTEKIVTGDDNVELVNQYRGEYEGLFPVLSKALNDELVLAVLLPPIELLGNADGQLEEIVEYSRLVAGKLVLFIEVTLTEAHRERLREAKASSARPPFILPVRPLKAGDGVAFSDKRLGLHVGDAVFPQMTAGAKAIFDDKESFSVQSLQRLLYDIYEERRKDNIRYTAKDTVSDKDILRYFWKNPD